MTSHNFLKELWTHKKKLNNKETKMLWNMKITYNKRPWTKLSSHKNIKSSCFFVQPLSPICQGAWQVLRICGAGLLELDTSTVVYRQVQQRPAWSVHNCHEMLGISVFWATSHVSSNLHNIHIATPIIPPFSQAIYSNHMLLQFLSSAWAVQIVLSIVLLNLSTAAFTCGQ